MENQILKTAYGECVFASREQLCVNYGEDHIFQLESVYRHLHPNASILGYLEHVEGRYPFLWVKGDQCPTLWNPILIQEQSDYLAKSLGFEVNSSEELETVIVFTKEQLLHTEHWGNGSRFLSKETTCRKAVFHCAVWRIK